RAMVFTFAVPVIMLLVFGSAFGSQTDPTTHLQYLVVTTLQMASYGAMMAALSQAFAIVNLAVDLVYPVLDRERCGGHSRRSFRGDSTWFVDVEDDRVDASGLLEHLGPTDQDAELRPAPGADQ
ncbi:hypothetical protein IAE22_32315, partial [Bacillus sp. S34]|nr:hypothetical protein [Bacillus sp. S34]